MPNHEDTEKQTDNTGFRMVTYAYRHLDVVVF